MTLPFLSNKYQMQFLFKYFFKSQYSKNTNTMKTIFIIRHAKSSWAELGARDFDRVLDKRGHTDAPRMATILKEAGVHPDLIVSSPAMRAKTTALYFAKEFDFSAEQIDYQSDIYEAVETDIFNIVRNLPNIANVVLLFGHNPTLTYFTNNFNPDPIENLPTCGIVRIALNVDDWSKFSDKTARVTGLWFPKMYK